MIKKVNKSVRLTIKKNRPRRFSSPTALDVSIDKKGASGRKVSHCLVATTNPVVRRAMQNALQGIGVLFTHVQGGVEALKSARATKVFDCIFLEITLPDMSALEVAHMLRQEEGLNQHTKIVLFTTIEDDKEGFVKDGVESYLQHPLAKSDLQGVLDLITR